MLVFVSSVPACSIVISISCVSISPRLFSGRLQYKAVGGVLDFFVLLGPTSADVVSQYTELVGRPRLPPLWSIGFHQCRWGYRTANETRSIVEQYISNALPLDAIWNDIDYCS
jgi:alpha-glucosidase (family GH31 glycosyl hydrolase)